MARMRSKMRAVESSMASAMRSARSVDACCDSSSAVLSGVRNPGSAARCSGVMPASANSGAICPVFAIWRSVQPVDQRLFADRYLCRRQGGLAFQAAAHVLIPFAQCLHVLRLKTKTAQAEALAAEDLQLLQHAGGGALRGRRGIVELMRQVAGQLAERVQLL